MNIRCVEFRTCLERALTRGGADLARSLGWHEHLLGCGACRDLLAAEEALEELLGSLPDPRLPADLTQRVLSRLRMERGGEALERLLDADRGTDVPSGLSARVLAGVQGQRRDAQLDALLDRVPAPEVPAGLARGLLGRLEHERGSAKKAATGDVLRPWAFAFAAAAALMLMFGAWLRSGDPSATEPMNEMARAGGDPPERSVVVETSEPHRDPDDDPDVEDELLAALDVLENWEWVSSDDLDLLLAEIDPAEWALLEYADDSLDPFDPSALQEELR